MENAVSPPKTSLFPFILLSIVFFSLGIGSGYLLWGRQEPVVATVVVTATAQPQQVTRYDVPVDDDPFIGPEDAPITIIEFSDYECPYCRKWYVEVLDRLLANYPDQIRFVYRDLPIRGHVNAVPAAEAANCSGEQGAYWEFHNALFSMRYGLNAEAYRQYASELELDMEAFNACTESGRQQAEVEADYYYAANLGITSTPTFFINGIPIVGALPYETFKQIIDKELAGEIP